MNSVSTANDLTLLAPVLGLLASVGLIALANPSGLSKSVAARFTVQPTSSIDTALAWLKSNLLSKKLVKRTSIQEEQDLLNQLAELAEQVAFCLDAGESLQYALDRLLLRSSGELSNQLEIATQRAQLGSSFEVELLDLAKSNQNRYLVEFFTLCALALRRGAPLSQILRGQAQTASAQIRANHLVLAGKNETRMLIPLVTLVLPVTVLFALFPSYQLLTSGYL